MPGGPAALGAGVSRVLLTRRAGAPATGPDTQSRQIGQQPLEVEGGQRRVRVLGGLLQPGTGRGAKQKLRLEAGDAKTPPAPWLRGFRHQEPGGRRRLSDLPPDPISPDRGHLLEPELYLLLLPGVPGAGRAGVPQSQGQASPFQPQLHRERGAPGGDPKGQCEGLPVAEPLVSQELL